ncbi:Similar to S.cerevisiae protein MED6 (Subunit of the RNA polymerase II mediator complex) [Malassezia sympodialis ATCC 42132]|uniref:Mediator of RNA polymerase II transcription subunit 6 n=1 Tax=Malassezia sympodialis (strain ATCC 42132) TaxID=1230383 RepID=A0A1M8A2I1_MALS4|nr:Similar to S.cerevisiae protein MED6 (Subunit of the RNA polymerase II mediator complex) [Malassezia sympodialis ATCC 42132]
MVAPSEDGSVNPLQLQWKNPELLAFLGAQKGIVGAGQSVLDVNNVMEYFSTSPFYDRRSNNEHVRMQSAALVAQIMATTPLSGEELMRTITKRQEEELRRFTGLEYALVHARPPGCFVVHKRWRRSPDLVDAPLAAFYIIHDCVYQAPDLYTILSTRLQSTVLGLTTTLCQQREHRATFSPRRGQYGRFLTGDAPKESSSGAEA